MIIIINIPTSFHSVYVVVCILDILKLSSSSFFPERSALLSKSSILWVPWGMERGFSRERKQIVCQTLCIRISLFPHSSASPSLWTFIWFTKESVSIFSRDRARLGVSRVNTLTQTHSICIKIEQNSKFTYLCQIYLKDRNSQWCRIVTCVDSLLRDWIAVCVNVNKKQGNPRRVFVIQKNNQTIAHFPSWHQRQWRTALDCEIWESWVYPDEYMISPWVHELNVV